MPYADSAPTLTSGNVTIRAHRPDEYITLGELHACQQMIEALGARLSA